MENTPQDRPAQPPLRQRLAQAGVDELYQYGFENFSVRRIATKCGVSCAAPYRHFADKQAFIAAIMKDINNQWLVRQRFVLENCHGSTRKKIVDVSVEYVRFLVEHAQFRSIIMMKYENCTKEFQALRSSLNHETYILVTKYCQEVNMPPALKHRRIYVVRSLIYGAALMFDNGELEYNEENMQMVWQCIDREFDLP